MSETTKHPACVPDIPPLLSFAHPPLSNEPLANKVTYDAWSLKGMSPLLLVFATIAAEHMQAILD